ncbi:MAG TPA: glycosyltransferase family 61 protein [Mucilaginibacter sp.]
MPLGEFSFDKLAPNYAVLYQHDENPVRRKPPITTGDIHEKFKKALYTPLQKAFVIEAKGWRVWGNQGAVITDTNYLFGDVSREFDNKTHSIFNQFKLIGPTYTEGNVAVLAASGSFVYYHWMFDILPRISFLKRSGIFDKIDKFIVDCTPNQYQEETLARAGIQSSKIIKSNDHWNFHLKAEKLIVPSLVLPLDQPSLDVCMYLRQLYSNEVQEQKEAVNIYIQRLSGRKISNEDEVISFLKTLSFQVINPEKLSVAEQARNFSNARMVVGAHGAGLTNIVFCRPGTVVVDLFSPEWVNPCYWIIAEHLDLKYGYLEGNKLKQKKKGKGADIEVDLDQLKSLFSKLLADDR